MKSTYAGLGVMGLLFASSAYAANSPLPLPGTPIYSSYTTSSPDGNQSYAIATGTTTSAGSPDSQEFSVSSPETLSSVTFRLSDATPGDLGSIMVFLVPDPTSQNTPPSSGTTLTGAIQLGTILDSSLPISGQNGCSFGPGATSTQLDSCNTTLSLNYYIGTAGDYWIALVDGSDTNNGGTNPNPSNAQWWKAGTNPYPSLYESHVSAQAPNAGKITSTANFAFETQVDVPEPASMALLGAGIMGLGLVRRRRQASAR